LQKSAEMNEGYMGNVKHESTADVITKKWKRELRKLMNWIELNWIEKRMNWKKR
jgi:hypothetical protein